MKTVVHYYLVKISVSLFLINAVLVVTIDSVQAKPPSQVKYSVQRQENTKMRESLVLPYAFSTDDMGTVIGIGAMATGFYQKQMTVGGTVYGGGDSTGLALSLWDYRILDRERFFFSALGMVGEYPLLRAYSLLPDEFPPSSPRAGSNDSNFDDFIQAEGSSNWCCLCP